MFGTIRKHQTWLWAIIIAVTVVSFVVFFSPDARWMSGEPSVKADFGSINGQPITQAEILAADREVRLGQFIRSGGREWPGTDEATERNLERQRVSRVFLLQKVKELGVTPSEEAVGRMMHDRIGDYPAEKFEADFLSTHGLTWGDFERFIRNETAIVQLLHTASVSSRLVNPRDAEDYFRRENESLSVQLAVFSASNFLSQVPVTPAAISNYFNIHAAAYRIPRRITVSYVEFPASNHLAEANQHLNTLTNLDGALAEEYFRRGTNAFTGPDGKPLTQEQAKERMKDDIRRGQALVQARRVASVFGNELISQSDPNLLTNFARIAAAKGYTIKISPPFDNTGGLDENVFPEDFRAKAMALTTNTPIAFSPIVGSNSVFVIARHGELPSEMPELDKVKDKVTADYKQAQALEMARSAGRVFHVALTNGLAQKKSFLEIATAQNVKTVIVPPFSRANAESLTNLNVSVNPRMLASVVDDLEVGQASYFLPYAEGGLIAYLSSKTPVADAKVKTDLPEFIGRLRAYRQEEAFNAWFRRQAEVAKLTVPQREEPRLEPGTQ